MRKNYLFHLGCAVSISVFATNGVWARDIASPAMDLSQINLALNNDPLNAKLHYRAALAYESSSVAGNERREVSRAAYAMALKADATFWPAQVQLGLMALEDQDAGLAQQYLVDAGRLSPSEPVIFYALARAAYCNGDLGLANAAYSRASQLRAPETAGDFITAAAIRGRSGAGSDAEQYIQMLVKTGNTTPPMVLQAVSDGPSSLLSNGQQVKVAPSNEPANPDFVDLAKTLS